MKERKEGRNVRWSSSMSAYLSFFLKRPIVSLFFVYGAWNHFSNACPRQGKHRSNLHFFTTAALVLLQENCLLWECCRRRRRCILWCRSLNTRWPPKYTVSGMTETRGRRLLCRIYIPGGRKKVKEAEIWNPAWFVSGRFISGQDLSTPPPRQSDTVAAAAAAACAQLGKLCSYARIRIDSRSWPAEKGGS